MKKWEDTLVLSLTPILKVIKLIDTSALQIALIVDAEGKLLGTVTDGDVRRGILKGISLNDPVNSIMNKKPVVVNSNVSRKDLFITMKTAQIRHVPVVDQRGCVVGLGTLDEMLGMSSQDNWVVLMAGGLGNRLRPLTDDCPKPLLMVGNRPILETIIESFIEHGFKKFYITVNYRADMIEHFFGDGSKWGAEIRYVREEKRLGTAGALSLLPDINDKPVLVMNGDVLTKVNFRQLLEFHLEHNAMATMCIREYGFQVPFGVVKMEQQRLVGIDEKPRQSFFVNAGIYVLEPKAIALLPPHTFFDMPDLFKRLMEEQQETVVFPIREYWLDIGRVADYEQANIEFDEVFV